MHYLDFVVDGTSLRERMRVSEGFVTAFSREWRLRSASESADELLGQRPTEGLSAGRTALYICADCGDLGCGALTASLHVSDAEIS
ncbi:hypothetical protein EFY87_01480 [Flexivirga caeni]|uniref:Uncharacterized protein n=1 Tax=Flexivirga caeni TaxID=2294115 RepID=A0A3M9MID1_9MICO|nr:hypothetical protein EFY87_01480 [Flexivirga caeni]